MKTIKFVACGDIHGNEQCPKSVKALLAFCRDFKPDLVVCIGDLWDFKAIRKGAGDEEQASSLQEDWDCGEEFIREFFAFGEERIFLRGNHDERLWDLAKNTSSGICRDYANSGIENVETIMKETRGTMLPYDSIHGVYTCGSLSFVHGYGHAMHGAKQHSDAYGNVLFGHTHAIDYFRSVSHDLREAWNIGCLSELGPTYNRSQMRRLRWQNGWAFGMIHLGEKSHDVFQAKRRNGKFTIPTTIKSY
jgi:predicted phosphodiesterase